MITVKYEGATRKYTRYNLYDGNRVHIATIYEYDNKTEIRFTRHAPDANVILSPSVGLHQILLEGKYVDED